MMFVVRRAPRIAGRIRTRTVLHVGECGVGRALWRGCLLCSPRAALREAQVRRDDQEVGARVDVRTQPGVVAARNVGKAEDERRDLAPGSVLIERAGLNTQVPTRRATNSCDQVSRQAGLGIRSDLRPGYGVPLSRGAS